MERISGLLKNKLACELLTVKAAGKTCSIKCKKEKGGGSRRFKAVKRRHHRQIEQIYL